MKTIDANGTIIYRNENGAIHRLDGPAVIYQDRSEFWIINDKLHRLDGPAAEYPHGIKFWYVNGKFIDLNSQEEFERYLKLIAFQ